MTFLTFLCDFFNALKRINFRLLLEPGRNPNSGSSFAKRRCEPAVGFGVCFFTVFRPNRMGWDDAKAKIAMRINENAKSCLKFCEKKMFNFVSFIKHFLNFIFLPFQVKCFESQKNHTLKITEM